MVAESASENESLHSAIQELAPPLSTLSTQNGPSATEPTVSYENYSLPSIDLLNEPPENNALNDDELVDTAARLAGRLREFEMHKGITDPHLGDAYTFVGIERNTKPVLAWHLGERGMEDTEVFTEKLSDATSGRFQLTTDGWKPYENAVSYSLGTRDDFAQLIKVYAANREQKYSPPVEVETITKIQIGDPDPEVSTYGWT
jgi:hypothetical protein